MNIGIVVYSITGNTLSVAEQLKEELSKNNAVSILRVNALNDEQNSKHPVVLLDAPKVDEFDRVIFAGHIQAFSLVKAMKMYLNQLDDLTGKEVDIILTQHFPYSWLGGNKGLRTMRKIIQSKGGNVSLSGVVHWSRKDKQDEINNLIELFSV
jgi:flavodoxin